ncbi:MAG: tetratricopeptide repeat protein [Pseudomonadota bacterium]
MKNLRSIFAGLSLIAGAAVVFSAAPAPAFAQDDDNNRRRRQSATLDPAVGRVLSQIYEEDIANENWASAIQRLTGIINERGDRFKPYDTSIVYQLRGQAYSQIEPPNFRAARADFQRAIDAGGLPPDQVGGLRYAVAQLNFALGDYQGAISGLQAWIRASEQAGETPDANAFYLLGAAYTQITPPRYADARRPAERAVELLSEPKKSYYDLVNLVYSETKETTKRIALLETMINIWPGTEGYWRQLSGLYAGEKQDEKAFSVLEVAYRAGLIDDDTIVLQLAQYYSFFDNPYRGATLLEREMNAGKVPSNVKNLTLLSQLWSQAREHKRAIPVLERAAGQSPNGELFYRLGQTLFADEQYAKAEQALASARSRGGLGSRKLGDSWVLTGTALFSRAGPGDCTLRARSRRAFVNATRFETSARQARSYVEYIDAINSTEASQDRLAWQQANEERRATLERVSQQITVCRLQGGSEDCGALEERLAVLEKEEEDSRTPPTFGCEAPAAGDADGDVEEDAADGSDGGVKPDSADAETETPATPN